MEISRQGNYTDPANQVSAMDTDLKDKLRNRLKYVVLQYLQDNPDDTQIFGLPQQVDQVYNSDMYLQESINILNSLSEVFNLIDEHYQILNESDN
jgi:hypothetical protein